MEAGETSGYRRAAKRLLRHAWLLLAAAVFPGAGIATVTATVPEDSATLDVRVIVDASAWSDSATQRAGLDSAIHALLTVLPPGTSSAVWPLRSGPQQTASEAQSGVDLASATMFETSSTDALPAVFENLIKEWTVAPSATRRHVILLVAGAEAGHEVSASGDSAAEKRLLNELLPRLHQTRAALHVIAPTHADTALLQQLVVATDGWYTEASEPADAERHLLELLENLAQTNTLLLQDGLVKFDTTVATARLVLFRQDPNLPARLIPPGSEGFSQFNAPSNIAWRQEARFDVVTITKPAPGTWQVLTDNDSHNRAFADASLQLVLSALPRNAVAGKRREFTLALRQNGKLITDRNVLDHVVIKASQFQGFSEQRLWFPLDNGRAGDAIAEDGIYTVALDDFLPAHSYRFIVELEGLNFQRRHPLRMDVHDHSVWAHIAAGADDKHFTLSLLPRYGLVDPEMMTVIAHLTQAGMEPRELRVPRFTSTTWRLTLALETRSVRDVVEINVQANTASGQPISLWLPPMVLPAAKPAEHLHPRAASAAHPDTEVHANPVEELDDPATAQMPPTTSAFWPLWIISTLQLLSVNAALVALGWLMLRYWRRQESRWHTEIESALAHD